MKKYQVIMLLASMIMVHLSGCRSIDTTQQMAMTREMLDKKEQWRYKLPISEAPPSRPVFPHLQKSQLKNGLTILVVEDHRLPIAEISLVLKNGSAKDPYGYAGLNHLTMVMLKEGTRSLTSLELAEAFANLGTEVSVAVGKDMSQISSAVLSTKVEDVITLVASMVKEPRMNADDFARVKLLQRSQLSSQESLPSYVAQTNFLLLAYGEKHPYAYPSMGTLKTISKIELKDVKKAHAANFGANIAALVVVGDVTLPQIKKLAENHLGGWKKTFSPMLKINDPIPAKQMQIRLVARPQSPQTFILVGELAAHKKDKDLPALEVVQSIIAGLPTSRLSANLREAKGWTYGVKSQINPLLGKGPMIISTSIQVPHGADAIHEILMELERLTKNPVSDDELRIAKNKLLYSFADRYSTVGKIAHIIANQFVYALPLNSEEVFYNDIAKVSKEDILAAADRVLKKEQMVAVAVGELETLETPIEKMGLGKVSIEREPVHQSEQ